MEQQGYKHFSHTHNLVMHQLPEGLQVSCFGCNSSGTGTVYVCWQCNFFLHEQCYRATRSLKHPSHPTHPLTLVPFPTYPSNSFYCNSCENVGTGLSYSCADCEFDLHVQCAYSISRATSFQKTHQYQELVAPGGWNNGLQSSNMADHTVPFVSVPDSTLPIPFSSAHDPYRPPIPVSNAQYHPTSHDLGYVSVPPSRQNSIPAAQDPPLAHNLAFDSVPMSSQNAIASALYPSMAQAGPSFSIPTLNPRINIPSMPQDGPSISIPSNSQNPNASIQYPSMVQSGQSVSVPIKYPSNSIPSAQDPSNPQNGPSDSIPTRSQNTIASTGPSFSITTPNPRTNVPSMPQDGPSISIPSNSQNPNASIQYPSVAQSGESVSVPTNHQSNSIPSTQDPSKPQNRPSDSIPTRSQNPIATTRPSDLIPTSQDPSIPQSGPSFSIHDQSSQNPIAKAQYPSVAQTEPSVSVHPNPPNTISSSQDPLIPQNGFQDKGIMHFSHPHILSKVDLQEDEEDEVTCSGCEETLVGKGYSCLKRKCDFHLHESCFHLKKEIHHKSHPEHPLILLPLAPYNNKNDEFTCNACFSDGTGFTYHCSICKFDLHIQCVSLPETMKRDDHEHELKLYYSCPVKGDEYVFSCDVCHGDIEKDRWVYYCDSCDYGTHLGCVDCEECEGDISMLLDSQAQLQRAQFQLELARQQAQFVASLGASLSSLAG